MTGIRFVPGSRLAVVLGPSEFIALVDTDTGRTVRIKRARPGDEPTTSTPPPPA